MDTLREVAVIAWVVVMFLGVVQGAAYLSAYESPAVKAGPGGTLWPGWEPIDCQAYFKSEICTGEEPMPDRGDGIILPAQARGGSSE